MTNILENTATFSKDTQNTPLKVCFVCTGNTCRSPMADAVLNFLGNGKYIAESAGIMADKGAPMTQKAIQALTDAGIAPLQDRDYNNHIARQLNMGIIESCDKIVAVSAGHAMMIMQNFPLCASKVTSFSKNITDPYGMDQATYDKCLKEIISCIKEMFLISESDNA